MSVVIETHHLRISEPICIVGCDPANAIEEVLNELEVLVIASVCDELPGAFDESSKDSSVHFLGDCTHLDDQSPPVRGGRSS